MTRIGDVGKTTPAVGNLFVLSESVGDKRELLQVLFEGVRQCLRGRLALFRRAVLKQTERRLDGERFAVHLEAQVGDGRIEQPVPNRMTRHRLFVKKLL